MDERPEETLNPAEARVLLLVLEGICNVQIAARLTISEQTVKNHLRAIYDKTGMSTRAELMAHFMRTPKEILCWLRNVSSRAPKR